MTERDALATSRKLFAAWNAHDADAWIADLAPDFVYESDSLPQPTVRGHDGARAIFTTYLTAFPDLRFDIEQEIVSGPFVVVRWRAAGTRRSRSRRGQSDSAAHARRMLEHLGADRPA